MKEYNFDPTIVILILKKNCNFYLMKFDLILKVGFLAG